MRLTVEEIQGLNNAVKKYLSEYELRVYGSRTDDSKKGGDIDLLLIVGPDNLNTTLSIKHLLLVEMKNNIGDQKIDLTLCDAKKLQEEPFLSMVIKQSIDITILH